MRISVIILPFLIFISCVYGACRSISRQPNEYCHDLAKRCKINDNDFFKFNPNLKRDCTNLVPKQNVCCTPGGLSPSPDKDGRCAVYEVKPGDDCGVIGGQYGLTIKQIDQFNFKNSTSFGGTWGFRGCKNLQPGKICVSKGNKGPIPALQKDAQGNPVQCGPTASGNGTNVKCPLNVCCNNWGQCGLTKEFCDIVPNVNPGVKGCQDNCGMEYKPNSDPHAWGIQIGYYESWNNERSCQTMDIDALQIMVDINKYSHIHYAFGIIKDYKAYVNDTDTWRGFLKLKNAKKILSFGGWAFSTEDATRPIFGDSVLNKQFAHSVVDMINKYNLDGIDIDWEYPGATDLKGWAGSTPTVHPNDGENYLNFIKLLKPMMPKGKTLSIAAPASYWYLKNFPIKEMSDHLDYIVYMTYDLHGQWDYKKSPYLRSHVNKTETIDALTMIVTKAGVPSKKIIMGYASYGRSFQQADPKCYGPNCKFTAQGATPGKCTKTSGYLGYGEIQDIVDHGNVRKKYYDKESGSDILLYNKNDWVAYTNLTTKNGYGDRRIMSIEMYLGGVIEWAVDLRSSVYSIENMTDAIIIDSDSFIDYSNCEYSETENIDNIMEKDMYSFCYDYILANIMRDNATKSLQQFDKMIADGYQELYSQDYLPEAIAAGNAIYNAFWNNANITDNGDIVTNFDRFMDCSKQYCNGDNTATMKKGITLTDIQNAFIDFSQGSYILEMSYLIYPYSFEHDQQQNTYKYSSFPFINDTITYFNPSSDITNNRDQYNNMIKMLNDAINNPSYIDFVSVVNATMYSVSSLSSGVQSMQNIMNIGEKIKKQKDEEKANFILNIILDIIEVVVAFIPDVGPLISSAMQVAVGVVEGDTDPMTYVFAAAGAIGDIGDMFKVGKSFDEIADTTNTLRFSTTAKSTKSLIRFNKDPLIKKIEEIRMKSYPKVGMCKV